MFDTDKRGVLMAFTKEMLNKLTELVKTNQTNVAQQLNYPYGFTLSLNDKVCVFVHFEHHCGGSGNDDRVIIKFPGEKEIEIRERFSGTLYKDANNLLVLMASIIDKRKELEKSNQSPKQKIVDERREKQIRILNYLDSLLANQK